MQITAMDKTDRIAQAILGQTSPADKATVSPTERVAKATQAGQEFEAMFATQILAPMWEGVEVDENFGGGHGEEVFRSMLLQEYGKTIAASNSLGIAQHVRDEMLKMQEAQ
jgi:flagellar protein FlgJ